MAPRKPSIQNTPAWTIYQEMLVFCKDEQVIASEHAFYEYVLHEKYPDMTLGKYRYHFNELVKANFIRIEPKTRAVRVRLLQIIERDDPSLIPD